MHVFCKRVPNLLLNNPIKSLIFRGILIPFCSVYVDHLILEPLRAFAHCIMHVYCLHIRHFCLLPDKTYLGAKCDFEVWAFKQDKQPFDATPR